MNRARMALLAAVLSIPIAAALVSGAIATDRDPVVPPVVRIDQVSLDPRGAPTPSAITGPPGGAPDRPLSPGPPRVLPQPQVVAPAPPVSDDDDDDQRQDGSDTGDDDGGGDDDEGNGTGDDGGDDD